MIWGRVGRTEGGARVKACLYARIARTPRTVPRVPSRTRESSRADGRRRDRCGSSASYEEGPKQATGASGRMSAPEVGTSARQVVPLDVDGPKQVGWHDHHGMELTHVREFEPGARPSRERPPPSDHQPYLFPGQPIASPPLLRPQSSPLTHLPSPTVPQ